MANYKVVTYSIQEIEKQLNDLAREGWEPFLMSTTPSSPNIQTPISVTVILQKSRK